MKATGWTDAHFFWNRNVIEWNFGNGYSPVVSWERRAQQPDTHVDLPRLPPPFIPFPMRQANTSWPSWGSLPPGLLEAYTLAPIFRARRHDRQLSFSSSFRFSILQKARKHETWLNGTMRSRTGRLPVDLSVLEINRDGWIFSAFLFNVSFTCVDMSSLTLPASNSLHSMYLHNCQTKANVRCGFLRWDLSTNANQGELCLILPQFHL